MPGIIDGRELLSCNGNKIIKGIDLRRALSLAPAEGELE